MTGRSFEILLMVVIALAGMVVQWRLQSVFKKYSRVPFPGGLTGREVAERMLRANGITDVRVVSTPGQLTDHFDPRSKTVNLSEVVYNTNSVSAAAVAAHECGHAVQHATGYAPLRMRSALVPLIQISSQWSTLVIIAGIILIRTVPMLFWIGIGMIALAALFALITLPVEYNASNRAMAWLTQSGTLHGEQVFQARTALNWAACTYLVAALSAVATLIYFLGYRRQ
jgi:Zn-dependent membrane protease YugP